MVENKTNEKKIEQVTLPCGKCGTLYCGDCSYFNAAKTSFGRCWCGYYKSYSRNSDNIACDHFSR